MSQALLERLEHLTKTAPTVSLSLRGMLPSEAPASVVTLHQPSIELDAFDPDPMPVIRGSERPWLSDGRLILTTLHGRLTGDSATLAVETFYGVLEHDDRCGIPTLSPILSAWSAQHPWDGLTFDLLTTSSPSPALLTRGLTAERVTLRLPAWHPHLHYLSHKLAEHDSNAAYVEVPTDGWLVRIDHVLLKLAELLRQHAEPDDTTGWVRLTPKQMEAIFNCTWDTIKSDIEHGSLPARKLTTKRYLVDPKSLPLGWERRMK